MTPLRARRTSMSQPTGSRPSNVPAGPPDAEERVPIWPTDDPVETFFSEPTDLRTRLAEAARPPLSGALTYEPYYGLKEKAFSLSTDPRFLYKSGSHAPVFHELLAAIRRREGLIVLTGDIGTGKTTLCRAVIGHLDRKTFATFVPDPFVSREDLLKMLLVDFGVVSVDEVRRGRLRGASRVELSYPLYEFLKSLGPLDAFAVVVIDEAQNLALPLLEEIRILSDLEDARKLLQVVLVGQPEFRSQLKLPRLRQVDQRVSVRCELQPLSRDGAANYVAHRLSTAGGSSDRVAFEPASMDLIFEASGGVPRVINLICDRALEHGHRNQASRVGPGLVAGAIRDLQIGTPALEDIAVPIASPREPIPAPLKSTSIPQTPLFARPPVVPEERAPAPTAAASPRGLFEKQAAATEAPTRTSDLDVLLDLAPTPIRADASLLPRSSRPDLPEATDLIAERGETSLRFVQDQRRGRTRRFGMMTTMALAIIGTLTGVSLVAYLLWMRPLVAEHPALPPVPLPNRADVRRPDPPTSAATVILNATEPKVASAGRWAVQVAAFSTVARSSALIKRLSEAGYPAYEGQGKPGPESLRLVLVGPYETAEEAESVRARIRQVPDLGGALITRR